MNYFDILLAKKLEDDRDPKVEGLSVIENGRYHEDGVVYDPVIVEVPEPTLISKNITANGTYNASDDNADGYSSVSVNVPLPSNAYLLQTIEHESIATFADGTDNFVKALEVAIEPIQSGSGEPSPTNIRPIIGWNEVNVTRCGKNLFDESILLECSGWTVSDGIYSGDSVNVNAKYGNGVPNLAFKPNTQYTFGFTYGQDDSAGIGLAVVIRYADDTSTLKYCNLDSIGSVSVTSTAGKSIKRLELSYGANRTIHLSNMQLEEGTAPTTYESYNGTTYTIDLNSTRYDGTLDVVNGNETDNCDSITIDGTASWSMAAQGQRAVFRIDNIITNDHASHANTYTSGKWLSNWAEIQNSTAGMSNYTEQADEWIFRGQGEVSKNFFVATPVGQSEMTLEDFKAMLNATPIQIVYPLATPTTDDTQPTIIKSLQGDNNFFASTGEIELLQYWGKEQN